jgi:hypothetical protein
MELGSDLPRPEAIWLAYGDLVIALALSRARMTGKKSAKRFLKDLERLGEASDADEWLSGQLAALRLERQKLRGLMGPILERARKAVAELKL